jgi:hypothetical protein
VEESELLGLVEVGRVLTGEFDQLIEVLGSVIVPVRLGVAQACGRD